jgi:hypothetical protein
MNGSAALPDHVDDDGVRMADVSQLEIYWRGNPIPIPFTLCSFIYSILLFFLHIITHHMLTRD